MKVPESILAPASTALSVGAFAAVMGLIKELSVLEKEVQPYTKETSEAGPAPPGLKHRSLSTKAGRGRRTAYMRAPSSLGPSDAENAKQEASMVRVDRRLVLRLIKLLRIMIPSWRSKEAAWLSAMVGLLFARILCDLRMISLVVSVEMSVVRGERRAFMRNLGRFLRFMVPVACVNSLLKYATTEVSLHLRQRLTAYLQSKYLRGFTFYAVTNMNGRARGIDQLITQDVEQFCHSLTDFATNAIKPMLDMTIYVRRLQVSAGLALPAAIGAYLVTAGLVLTRVRRATGQYTALIQRREGDYRFVSNRLVTYAEEVAFYSGIKRERSTIEEAFHRLMAAVRRSQQFRFSMDVIDSVATKYLATALGWLLLHQSLQKISRSGSAPNRPASSVLPPPPGIPFASGSGSRDPYDAFHRSGRMLIYLAQAMASLVLAGRELTRLAGFTARVSTLESVLDDVGEEPVSMGMLSDLDRVIEFKEVPVVTPKGEVLIPSISLRVEAGSNVLVTGPNGAGKSSIFRILCGLWPVRGGRLIKPARGQLFYIPQKPYLTLGTLRDQVTYPHSREEMAAAGTTDEDVLQLLAQVQLEYLAGREGGLDAECDWGDVLSGGEKQRVAMARLFYHCPQFAVLDECTSAVSMDVEGFLYDHCKELGITLFTISHRRSLWKYHDHVLELDGRGGYSFKPIKQVLQEEAEEAEAAVAGNAQEADADEAEEA